MHLRVSESFLLNGLGSSELVTSVDNGYFAGELGEVHCFLNRGIAAAYYVYFKIFEEVCIAGCAVRNALAGEFFLTFAADRTRRSAGSDNQSFCIVIAVVAFQVFDLAIQLYVNDCIGNAVSAELLNLLCHSCDQGRAGFFLQAAWIVFDLVGDNDLSAVFLAFNQQGVDSGTACIRSGSQTSRTCT